MSGLIVFVHGFIGGEEHWKYVPRIVVPAFASFEVTSLTYSAEYNSFADVTRSAEQILTTIKTDHANAAPIFLVGYSMGGIIAREICLKLLNNPAEKGWLQKVRGVITVGAPLCGLQTTLHYGSAALGALLSTKVQQIKDGKFIYERYEAAIKAAKARGIDGPKQIHIEIENDGVCAPHDTSLYTTDDRWYGVIPGTHTNFLPTGTDESRLANIIIKIIRSLHSVPAQATATFEPDTILEASADFGRYETAELKRFSRYRLPISRTVRTRQDDPAGKKVETGRLLAECPAGAIIVAPSGFGKTTLAISLLRQAIEERWGNSQSLLPFDTPAPDLEEAGLPVVEFMHRRLSAHCPGVTADSLKNVLRETGATVLCDGFDRTTPAFRRELNAEFVNLLRDYPRVQLFVFSRDAAKPNLALPLFELEALSDEQMRELEKLILDDGGALYFSIVGMMSPTLSSLCVNPLLLKLVLDYWKCSNDFPRKIELLFRSWLDNILKAQPTELVSTIIREEALTLIAVATTDAPISGEQAVLLLQGNRLAAIILDELIACDAVSVTGSVVEVQHEALADYLRAKAIASTAKDALLPRLHTLAMPAESFFPVLLMALLPTRGLQTTLWKRLAEVHIGVYLDALRYRFDVSSELERLETAELSENYLDDLMEGIELPLNGFFPNLREAVTENLIGDGKAAFAATGQVSAHPGALFYKLHPRGPGVPRITVEMPRLPGTLRGVNLDLSRYRIDSARLLGMTLLRDTVLKVVRHQQLKGGPIWAAERLIGRVRYLKHTHGADVSLTASLDTLEALLRPLANIEIIDDGAFSGGERFSVQSLLDDIATLRLASVSALDPWWLRLGWNESATLQDEEVIRRVLDEEYRRTQLVFAEIADASFPRLCEGMSFFTSLPIRWKLEVARRDRTEGTSTVWFRSMPVSTWDEAGADVTFTEQGAPFPDPKETQAALARLNRPNDRFVRFGGFTQLSFYDGSQWNGHYDGATTVTHEVCSLLTEELKHVFSGLPSGDGAF